MQKKHIAIGLFGKGSTNHLHRADVVAAFWRQGFRISFLVREDYIDLLSRLDNCSYLVCRVHEEKGWRAPILRACQNIRKLYPAWDAGQLRVHEARNPPSRVRLWSPIYLWLNRLAARFRVCAAGATCLESALYRPELVQGIDPGQFDLFVLLGIGTVHSELEGAVTYWATVHRIPCLHVIGNYDHVASKGFRGILPKLLLVWSPQMVEDAQRYQWISLSRLRMIGSLRYNSIDRAQLQAPEEFLRRIGLVPGKKTIVFAGHAFAEQYFEMLAAYRELLETGEPCQLILRLYPNKTFMNSVYLEPLMEYAKTMPQVYISFADPHFREGFRDREVLQVEEEELWNILNCCDVLVDYYSTITLEGAIFDKPIIHMHYLPKTAQPYEKKPKRVATWDQIHNRRIMDYGAVEVVYSRNELLDAIKNNLKEPMRFSSARKNMVARECGPLDGRACERLLSACRDMLAISDADVRGEH